MTLYDTNTLLDQGDSKPDSVVFCSLKAFYDYTALYKEPIGEKDTVRCKHTDRSRQDKATKIKTHPNKMPGRVTKLIKNLLKF